MAYVFINAESKYLKITEASEFISRKSYTWVELNQADVFISSKLSSALRNINFANPSMVRNLEDKVITSLSVELKRTVTIIKDRN